MNSQQIKLLKKVYVGINKNIKNKKWKCVIDSCNCYSINSHLLQQNGILNTISEDNHVIEIKPVDVFIRKENEPSMDFKRIGVGHALSLGLFCNTHDNELFRKVETFPINFCDKENQLLLSYRAVCTEIRKKEHNIEIYSRLINSNLLRGFIQIESCQQFLNGTKRGIDDLLVYKKAFENELNNSKNDFEFINIKYPIIKVYCSACFSPYETLISPLEEIPLNYVFIHVIPYNQELNIIIGYNKKYFNRYIIDYVDSWRDLKILDLEMMLTNLFATKVENWGLSPAIFRNIDKETLFKFIDYFGKNVFNYLANQKIDFNLFENNNYGK